MIASYSPIIGKCCGSEKMYLTKILRPICQSFAHQILVDGPLGNPDLATWNCLYKKSTSPILKANAGRWIGSDELVILIVCWQDTINMASESTARWLHFGS